MNPLQENGEVEDEEYKIDITNTQISNIDSYMKTETAEECINFQVKNETEPHIYKPNDKKALMLKLKFQIANLLDTTINPLNNRIIFTKASTVIEKKDKIKFRKLKSTGKIEEEKECVKCLKKFSDTQSALEGVTCKVCREQCTDNKVHSDAPKKLKSCVKQVKIMRCMECTGKFTSKKLLKIHKAMRHICMSCKVCGKQIAGSISMGQHMGYHRRRRTMMLSVEDDSNKQYECVVCRHVYRHQHILLTHQRRVHNVTIEGMLIPAFKCKVCQKPYPSRTGLFNHVKYQHDSFERQLYLCDICGKAVRDSGTFKAHMQIHTGDKPFKCNKCERTFRRISTLRAHTRIHIGEKPYVCQECGNSFVQITSLRIHERYHLKEKPFKCLLCNRGFIYKEVLHVHMGKCTGDNHFNLI